MNAAPRIFVAHPDPLWRAVLGRDLERRGARLFAASTAGELMGRRWPFPPELIVLDAAALPLPAGLACRRTRPVPLVVLSGPAADRPSAWRDVAGVYALKASSARGLVDILVRIFRGRLASLSDSVQRPALVMCVDDDAAFLRSLARLLSRRGYRVVTFTAPERALEAIPEIHPDLALLDIRMAGMSGLDLAAEIREAHGAQIPIVMLSALDGDQEYAESFRRGACRYIDKSSDPRTLLDVVGSLAKGGDPMCQ